MLGLPQNSVLNLDNRGRLAIGDRHNPSAWLVIDNTPQISTDSALQINVGAEGGTNAITVLNNGNIGFGTVNPGVKLDIVNGTIRLDTNIDSATGFITKNTVLDHSHTGYYVELGSGSGILTALEAFRANNNTRFRIRLHDHVYFETTAGTANIRFVITGGGNITLTGGKTGIGTITPDTLLQIANNNWFSAKNFSGTSFVNMLKVNASDEIEVGGTMNISGGLEAPSDAGAVTLFDMPVTSASGAGVEMSATVRIDSTNILKVYAESDGAGGIQNPRVQCFGDIYPGTDNLRYIGKNSITSPLAYKGVVLKDTTNGNYYRIEVINGTITATQIT